MKAIPTIIRSLLLFFFFASIFSGVSITQGLIGKIAAGVIYGLIIFSVPMVLGFFKLPDNFGAMFLLATIMSFIYFFLIKIGLLGLGSIGATTIDWGVSWIATTRLDDLTTLVTVAVVTALASTWLEKTSIIKK